MLYRLAADAVVVVHLAFILFVVCGGFVAWYWHSVAWLHIPSAIWGALIEFAGWVCPLTPLENKLRLLAGQVGYAGGFVEHYLIPVIYPAQLSLELRLVIGSLVVVFNAFAYTVYFKRRLGFRLAKPD